MSAGALGVQRELVEEVRAPAVHLELSRSVRWTPVRYLIEELRWIIGELFHVEGGLIVDARTLKQPSRGLGGVGGGS